MKYSFLFVLVYSLSLYSADIVTDKNNSEMVRSDSKINIVQSPKDKSIETRIKNILAASELIKDTVVTSNEGIVTLRGEISKKAQSEWAEKIAADTEGVIAVINKLEVAKGDLLDMSPAKSEAQNLAHRFVAVLPYLVASLIVLLIFIALGYGASKLGRSAARRRVSNPLLVELIAKLFALPLILLGLYFVLRISGLTGMAVTVLGGTGALGLVIGFAMKNILENYFSGLMLSLGNPYRIGDTVRIAGFEGVVQKLTTRGTILIDNDGNHIIIPNSAILGGTIVNQSANPVTRIKMNLEFKNTESVTKVREVITASLSEIPDILKDPKTVVVIEDLSRSRMTIGIYGWIDTKKSSPMKVKSLAFETMKSKLCEADISFASESMTVAIERHKIESEPKAIVSHPVKHFETEAEQTQILNKASQGRSIAHGANLLE